MPSQLGSRLPRLLCGAAKPLCAPTVSLWRERARSPEHVNFRKRPLLSRAVCGALTFHSPIMTHIKTRLSVYASFIRVAVPGT